MPRSIPYDPSLELGGIVPEAHIQALEGVSAKQGEVDGALAQLNSFMMLKRKLEMTAAELVSIGIPVTNLQTRMESVSHEIEEAATRYAEVCTANLPEIARMRASLPGVSEHYESPLDYGRSMIKKLPLSSDSMEMDAQFFTFEATNKHSKHSKDGGPDEAIAAMKSFVSMASMKNLGKDRSEQMASSVASQTTHQMNEHGLQGTLLISANCTHKSSQMWCPFVLCPDKAVDTWNQIASDGGTLTEIDTTDHEALEAEADATGSSDGPGRESIRLISGASYGSSFVGMVHILKDKRTKSAKEMYRLASELQVEFELSSWMAMQSGEFGKSKKFSASAEQLLSSQRISTHVSLVTVGIIPTIQSQSVQNAAESMMRHSRMPGTQLDDMAVLDAATRTARASMTQQVGAARIANQLGELKNQAAKSVITALVEHQEAATKMLDIDSLMTAFSDFVNKAASGDVGVPIQFFIRPVTRRQIIKQWVAKYGADKADLGAAASESDEGEGDD